jgi:histidyl-tRNA synthetase
MENLKCKGARDLLPADTERFRYIEDAFRFSCKKWGYKEVKTPTIEYLNLFTSAGTLTPRMLSKVYSFLDWDGWSGERVVLRPDGTIPVARLYSENLYEQKIARLYYVTNVFAFEETGTQNREKWQCGAELVGSAKAISDVELIMLVKEILSNLEINSYEIQLSHAGLLKSLLKELELSSEEYKEILTQILDGDWQRLLEIQTDNSDMKRILSLLINFKGKSSSFLENLRSLPKISPELEQEINNFVEISTYLDNIGCLYQIDITSIRGFEYYTGLCFKLTINGEKIASGGRYDNLIPIIGNINSPACGFALFIDPLINILEISEDQKIDRTVAIKINDMVPKTVKLAFELSNVLRKSGYSTEFAIDEYKPQSLWTITVRTKTPIYVITEQVQNKEREANTIDNVLDIIGGSP